MKVSILGFFLLLISVKYSGAQTNQTTTADGKLEQEIIALSNKKW